MKPYAAGENGFTVPELLVAVVVTTIMSGVLMMVTFRFYTNAVQSQQAAELALESQTLLGQLTDDLRLATGISSANTIADPAKPDGWTTSDPDNVLVITMPATDNANNIIYDPATGLPYSNDVVYFLQGNTMYKRTLRNEAAPGNTATATCPTASASPSCPTDRVFSQSAADLRFTMYDINNAAVTIASEARSLLVSVDFAKNVFGKDITLGNTTRITQRNN